MKTVIAFALFIAAISAAPKLDLKEADLRQPRIVTNAIESAIDDIRHLIRDNGFDPWEVEKDVVQFEHDVPSIKIDGEVEDLLVVGLSDIRINNLSFNVLTTRLSFDLELPKVSLRLKYGEADMDLLGNDMTVAGGGYGAAKSIRVRGNMRVNVSIISGISIREVNMIFSLGSLEAHVEKFLFQGEDETETLSNLLNHQIPNFIQENSAEINAALEALVLWIADQIL